MRNLLLVWAWMALPFFSCPSAQADPSAVTVVSPGGNIEVTLTLAEGGPRYQVAHLGKVLIEPSGLGFAFADHPSLQAGLAVADTTLIRRRSINETWQPVWGTDNAVRNRCEELFLPLVEKAAPHRRLDLVFRVFDDGVGFRYVIPAQVGIDSLLIAEELTEFRLAGDWTSWWIPGDFDSYEHLYRQTPVSEISTVNTPVTFRADDGVHLSIHEANLTDYAGMTLRKIEGTATGLRSELVPWPDGIRVKGQAPLVTPWRTIQIGLRAGDLVESHLIQNLNEPCALAETDWITPMKYVGVWWAMHIGRATWAEGPRHEANTGQTKRLMDFAAAHGLGGVLVEGWNMGWQDWAGQDLTTPAADFDLGEVVRYGRERGVQLIGHHETGGNVPRYEEQMDAAFALYDSVGVRIIKTGYAGKMLPPGVHHHSQPMVRHYRAVVEKAARHHIMLDAHEPIKDTGISRTWPNMMTREGARGMEYNAWSDGNPPDHTVTLPFTRLLGGPMDYTPGIFDLTFDRYRLGNRVWTTLSKQLAHYVTLYSPLQMAADLIENYEGHPAFKFIEDVPVNWDQSLVLGGEVGDFLVVARRSGQEWFIGAETDENPRAFLLDTGFLGAGTAWIAEIYCDAPESGLDENPTAFEVLKVALVSGQTLDLALTTGGGAAIRLQPQDAAAPTPGLSSAQFNAVSAQKMMRYQSLRIHGQPVMVEHLARGKQLTLATSYSASYTGGGPDALCDGRRGTIDYQNHWQGFDGQDLDAVIDLGEAQPVGRVTVGFYQFLMSWIFPPRTVTITVSRDGETWHTFSQGSPPLDRNLESKIILETGGPGTVRTARYIRVQAENFGQIPEWHSAAGNQAWLFVDEIVVSAE